MKKCAFSAILYKKDWGEDYENLRKMNGPDVYEAGGKKVTKSKFNAYMKKIKKGGKNTASKIKFQKNTAANRKKYLG